MRGRFRLGTVGAEEHVLSSELAEICGRAVGCTQQPACSERQLLLPFALHRCCCFLYFGCLFPHAQVRTEFGMCRARSFLGVALGGEGPTGRSLILDIGEEKEQLMPILVPELCRPQTEGLSAMRMVQMGGCLPQFLMGC